MMVSASENNYNTFIEILIYLYHSVNNVCDRIIKLLVICILEKLSNVTNRPFDLGVLK